MLGKAISEMKTHGRSAVITANKGDYWVLHAGEIVVGKARGAVSLYDLRRGRSFEFPGAGEISSRRIRIIRSAKGRADVETVLKGMRSSYALTSPIARGLSSIRALSIITANATLAQRLGAGPSSCYCTNPNLDYPHPYNPPPVPRGNMCFCGHEIVCI